MTPAKQMFTNADEKRPVGDCWRTCIAMLLDLPVEEVPHFVDLHYDADAVTTDRWPEFEGIEVEVPAYAAATQVWLRERGLALHSYDGPPGNYTGFAIATGPSPRGDFSHAIIVYTVAMEPQDTRGDGILRPIPDEWRPAADPHPSNDYLAGPPTEFAIVQPAEIWIEGAAS